MKLKDFWIQKRLRSLLSCTDRRKPVFRPLEEVRDILLLCHVNDQEALRPGIARLHQLHKQVYTGMYLPDGNRPDNVPSPTLFLNAKEDLNRLHIPSPALLKQFEEIKADLLIDLTPSTCYEMRYIMLRHPCRFKVGAKQADHEPDFYDFSILPTKREDITTIFGQILFYLQVIRSE